MSIYSQYAGEIESEKYQAGIYIDTYYNRLLAYEGYKAEVIDFMRQNGISQEVSVLDVGCGTGWFLDLLQQQGWNNLSGLDLSPDMLVIAKQMVPAAKLYEAPIQELDYAAEKYDVITCLATLHHMPDLKFVANKLFSLLNPGGKLIVHEPNKDWFYGRYTLWRVLMRTFYAPLRIKNHFRVKKLREPWKMVPPSPHHEDVRTVDLVTTLQCAGFQSLNVTYKNTLMRVLEGMLFRDSVFDRLLYRFVRSFDQSFLDRLAIDRGGAVLLCFQKPE